MPLRPEDIEAKRRSGEMQRLRLKAAKQQMPSFREEVFARRYPGGPQEGPMVAAGAPETVRTRRETPGGLAGARSLAMEAPSGLDYATPVKTAAGTWQWRPQAYTVKGERFPMAGAQERIGRMERDIADIRGQRREAAELELARRGIETRYGTQGWRGAQVAAEYGPGGTEQQRIDIARQRAIEEGEIGRGQLGIRRGELGLERERFGAEKGWKERAFQLQEAQVGRPDLTTKRYAHAWAEDEMDRAEAGTETTPHSEVLKKEIKEKGRDAVRKRLIEQFYQSMKIGTTAGQRVSWEDVEKSMTQQR